MIKYTPIQAEEFEAVFNLVKGGLFPFVDQVFGWDDDFQRERLHEDYQWEWFHWVEIDAEQKALVCFKRYEVGIHVHLLIVKPSYQQQGVAKNIMADLNDLGVREQRDITLSSFKCNDIAIKLYQSLGYEITGEEEHFSNFRLSISES